MIHGPPWHPLCTAVRSGGLHSIPAGSASSVYNPGPPVGLLLIRSCISFPVYTHCFLHLDLTLAPLKLYIDNRPVCNLNTLQKIESTPQTPR